MTLVQRPGSRFFAAFYRWNRCTRAFPDLHAYLPLLRPDRTDEPMLKLMPMPIPVFFAS